MTISLSPIRSPRHSHRGVNRTNLTLSVFGSESLDFDTRISSGHQGHQLHTGRIGGV
jgi:hypothetical protein